VRVAVGGDASTGTGAATVRRMERQRLILHFLFVRVDQLPLSSKTNMATLVNFPNVVIRAPPPRKIKQKKRKKLLTIWQKTERQG
jgi:hypothetical protein